MKCQISLKPWNLRIFHFLYPRAAVSSLNSWKDRRQGDLLNKFISKSSREVRDALACILGGINGDFGAFFGTRRQVLTGVRSRVRRERAGIEVLVDKLALRVLLDIEGRIASTAMLATSDSEFRHRTRHIFRRSRQRFS
jgi:hypothetical protein